MSNDELFYAHEKFKLTESAEQRRRYLTWVAEDLFKICWDEAGAALTPTFDVIAEAYTEPQRWFHTELHLLHCIHLLLKMHAFVSGTRCEIMLAVFFHDVVYNPKALDNEKRSAERFATLARLAHTDEGRIDRVASMIMTTQHHVGHTVDEILLNDIDLSILGAPPAIFAKYEEDARREFAHLTDEQWRSGRREVLAGFLMRPSIFRTLALQTLFEDQARTNITNAISDR